MHAPVCCSPASRGGVTWHRDQLLVEYPIATGLLDTDRLDRLLGAVSPCFWWINSTVFAGSVVILCFSHCWYKRVHRHHRSEYANS